METQITTENKVDAQFDQLDCYFADKAEATLFKKTALAVWKSEGFIRENSTPAYKRSLWSAIELIAQLGLKPGKQYGHIDMHIEKLSGEEVVTCRPMYQGYLEVAYRDPDLILVKADVVRRGDTFKDNGIDKIPSHEKKLEYTQEESKIIGSYAVATYKGGEIVREIMTLADLDKIKKHITSKAYAKYVNGVEQEKKLTGIASTWEEEWAKVKVIRRLLKSLRRSYSIHEQTALDELDNQDYEVAK